jgi:hypothetical protein
MPKPKKPKKPKKEGGMYRLGQQLGLYVTGQSDTWRPPSSASLQRPGLQDPDRKSTRLNSSHAT